MPETVVMESKLQTSVEYVKFYPPPDLYQFLFGKEVYIYGRISVTDHPDKEPIILFDCKQEDPQVIEIGHAVYGLIPLSDLYPDPPRALDHPDHTLYLTFHLYIQIDDAPDQPYTIIADSEFVQDLSEGSHSFLLEGKSDYFIKVGYAFFWGTRVKVDFTINKQAAKGAKGQGQVSASSSGNKQKLHGIIQAYCHCQRPRSRVYLFLKGVDESTSVPIGSLVPLHRRFIIAPLRDFSFLFIKFELYDYEKSFAEDVIAFPIKTIPDSSYPPKFITNKQRTHVKTILDGLITVSITFLD